jgi:hypothetical protein
MDRTAVALGGLYARYPPKCGVYRREPQHPLNVDSSRMLGAH